MKKTADILFDYGPVLLFVIWIVCAVFWQTFPRVPRNDECLHFQNCYQLLSGNYLSPDNRSHYPPLGYYILTLFTLVRPSIASIWLPNLLCALLTFGALYNSVERTFGKFCAFAAAAGLMMSPLMGACTRLCMTDNALIAAMSACLAGLLLSRGFRVRRFSLLAGTAFGCAFMCKVGVLLYLAVPVLLAMLYCEPATGSRTFADRIYACLPSKKQLVNMAAAAACFLLMVVPYLWRVTRLLEAVLEPAVDPNPVPAGGWYAAVKGMEYSLFAWGLGLPLTLIITAAAAAALVCRWKSGRSILPLIGGFCALAVPVVLLTFSPFRQVHYTLPIALLGAFYLSFCLNDVLNFTQTQGSSVLAGRISLCAAAYCTVFVLTISLTPFIVYLPHSDSRVTNAFTRPDMGGPSLKSLACTMLGPCLPYYDHPQQTFDILERIMQKFPHCPKGAYPQVGIDHTRCPYILLGERLPDELAFPIFAMYKAVAGVEHIGACYTHELPGVDYCQFFVAPASAVPPANGRWIKVSTYDFSGCKVVLYMRN